MGFLVVWVMLLKIEFNDLQVGWGSRNVSGVLEGIRMVFILFHKDFPEPLVSSAETAEHRRAGSLVGI